MEKMEKTQRKYDQFLRNFRVNKYNEAKIIIYLAKNKLILIYIILVL